MTDTVDIVLIGHIDKGQIVVGDNASTATGGAVYYGGIVLLRLGLRTAIVTRLAEADLPLLEELRAAGAQLYPVLTEETTGIENVIPDPRSDKRRCYQRGFAGTFQAADLPTVQARLYYVGTIITDEVDLPFLETVAARGPLALDAQGCLRKRVGDELVTAEWPWAEQALPLVQYLKVDDREALALTGDGDPHRAAERLAAQGPKEVVLTHQEGVLVLAEGQFYEAPFQPRSLAGRTGRGDTCFAAYLGRRLLGDAPQEAVEFAAELTTMKLEQPGPFRGSVEEVLHRLHAR
ncbi:MAG: PfkB family carbohydrate kinase [Candidatus Bipolaricaulota bacterium]